MLVDMRRDADVDAAIDSWRAAVIEAHREGYVFLDLLTVVDRTNLSLDAWGPWEFLAHLVCPQDGRRRWVRHLRDEPVIESICDVFPAAAWHEREVREMFGIEFIGSPPAGVRPLLLVDQNSGVDEGAPPSFPLRKRTPLLARLTTPWPGVHEPGGGERASRRSRRTSRPPGVPQAWLTESTEQEGIHE